MASRTLLLKIEADVSIQFTLVVLCRSLGITAEEFHPNVLSGKVRKKPPGEGWMGADWGQRPTVKFATRSCLRDKLHYSAPRPTIERRMRRVG